MQGGWTMAIAIGDDLQRNHATVPLPVTSTLASNMVKDAEVPVDVSVQAVRTEATAKRMWIGYAVLGLLIAAYLISLLVRSPAQQWTWLDGWSVAGIEV